MLNPPLKPENTGRPTAPITIYTRITNIVLCHTNKEAIIYIAKVASEIGITPIGNDTGARMHKHAAKRPINVIFFYFHVSPLLLDKKQVH